MPWQRTTAEPGRKSPYGHDLRWRVVWQRLAFEATFLQIAERLSISVSTAQRIYTLFEITGDVSPKLKGPRRSMRKLDDYMELFVIGIVLEKPPLLLSELCKLIYDHSGIAVSEATVCRLLHRHGITRQKIKQVALQRSFYLRGCFMAQVLLYHRSMFVWLDESGCDKRNFMRKYGYSIRGQTPRCHRLLLRGTRISVIAAMASDGLVACECTTGSVDSQKFFDFVRGSLIPHMHSFDGSSPKSIVIMDNCSIHRVPEITRLFAAVGILVMYLPPYSPDYNPIEEAFGFLKSYLRHHDELIQSLSDPTIVIREGLSKIKEHCNNWITYSGYK